MLDQDVVNGVFKMVKGLVEAQKSLGKKFEYEQIDSYIKSSSSIVGLTLSDEEYSRVFHDIEMYFKVEHKEGCAIYDDYDEIRNWYSNEDIENPYFWDRYKRYLGEYSSLDENSIKLLEKTTLPNIMNCLGNPNEKLDGEVQQRYGLIIGDVQSGKTATYTGLICKAVDAGYKVVILLAGITENLRRQTQERIDEGIVGKAVIWDKISKKNNIKTVGVGEYDSQVKAASYTSQSFDFVGGKDTIITSLQSHSSVVLFVIKKNVSVLRKLYIWLKNNNLPTYGQYIDCPLLLVDDEADNASVNTNKDETNPTLTNKMIRDICNLFKNTTYVGFTATPFANVFIDPDSADAMKQADLFPKDFIYVLPTPSSYIGAKKIFHEDGKYRKNIRYINDIEEPDYLSDEYKERAKKEIAELNAGPFYYRHNKEWDGELPESLTEAIYSFFLANIIRDLRGDGSKPRSMLINMSRFVKVQNVIKRYVEDIYGDFKLKIETDFSGNRTSDCKLPLYQKLEKLWKKHYSSVDIDIDRILDKENILKAIETIKIVVVNGSKNSDKLNYTGNHGLRVIAVGGIALSRGLTLEGLLTSYFYRNTATFDVLMQMGRWFGYRPYYDDIFRIWTSKESARWYEDISIATEELKDSLREMYDQRLTPKDFGIRVRDYSEELQITATNKMRNSYNVTEQVSFYGNLFETPYISLNVAQNAINLNQVEWLVDNLLENHFDFEQKGNAVIIKNIPKKTIEKFISEIVCSKRNPSFNVTLIKEFIEDESTQGLGMWDIAFQGGESEINYAIKGLESLTYVARSIHLEDNAVVVSSRRRLVSMNAGKLALSNEEKEIVKNRWITDGNSSKNIPARKYFEYLPDRKPILIIMLIHPNPATNDDNEKNKIIKFREELGDTKIAAFAIGFPGKAGGTISKHYKGNKIYYNQNMIDYYEEEVEDEE